MLRGRSRRCAACGERGGTGHAARLCGHHPLHALGLLAQPGRIAGGGVEDRRATLATYISAPTGWSPILYLRAGARRLWGRYPYFEAARIGGGSSVRGYSNGRFMGDAGVFGQAEVRVPLARAKLIVPGTLGVLGLADAGRVYLEGESSDTWHTGFGGGVWFAWLGGAKVFTLAVARGAERTTLAFRAGVAF